MAIFLQDQQQMDKECKRVIISWPGPISVYLGHRRWGFSAATPQQVVTTCPRQERQQPTTTQILPNIGIFRVPMMCAAHTADWIFPASFRRDLKKAVPVVPAPMLTPPLGLEANAQSAAPAAVQTQPLVANELLVKIDEVLSRNAASRRNSDLFGKTIEQIVEFDKNRVEEASPRYPVEWIAVSALAVILFLIVIVISRKRDQSVHLLLSLRVAALEERMKNHEMEVENGLNV